MKLLWLCNNAPGVVRSHITGKPASAVNWVDHVLTGLRQQGLTVRILYRGTAGSGVIDTQCSYASFGEELPYVYRPELEESFRMELRSFQPDVIHSWGVEYDHALAMVNAAEKEGMINRMVASIQGLCGFLAEHYTDGIPEKAVNHSTFRDLVRKDNIRQQQEKFRLRGQLEARAVGKLQHVIGRTLWDHARALELNPNINYHFCNETLRQCFYEGQWKYDICRKHSVFASSCSYPIKGFHYLLEAMAEVRKVYPDAVITVTGRSYLPARGKNLLRQGGYEAYLAKLTKRYHLEDAVQFLGDLSAEDMKRAFLDTNVFVLPSTLENSPNSLGEAMLLGVPCVAADVGGVRDMLADSTEGRIYEPGQVDQLAKHILELFSQEDKAARLGSAARDHARITHDPEKNLRDLINIYDEIR
ncbi:MAG: glycosyltransferase family 4 protein [Oscillospiraceae bacterium]|nr:glycosyltransferase family 4 protein [Oscillospiraceae bacterium]